MATVAFLGLGIMGAPMAVNLVRAGFDVVGWNRTASKATPVREAGGSVAETPADAVEGADFILSILDSGPVVREVFFDSGAVDRMSSGAVFIDMASIPPKMAQDHAARLANRRRLAPGAVPSHDIEPGAHEVDGHGCAHDTQAEEGETGHYPAPIPSTRTPNPAP